MAGQLQRVDAGGSEPVREDDDLAVCLVGHDVAAEEALAVLYERYAPTVYNLARRILGDAAQAEDVLQETFWRVWLYAAHYQPGRVRFVTWLLRVTTNLAISEQRRRARRPRTATLTQGGAGHPDGGESLTWDIPDGGVDVAEQVWQGEQRRAVSAGLATLPAAQRQAVELAYFGGLTHAQIAATQGAPLSTVKTRLALGLRKLADFLTGMGVTAPDCLA
ncbi:MAG: RNA polymerase sigma factor [Chloroflexota bacterium]|nr:RNA polymerase sigma factor [Chloroflexota bacterium]